MGAMVIAAVVTAVVDSSPSARDARGAPEDRRGADRLGGEAEAADHEKPQT